MLPYWHCKVKIGWSLSLVLNHKTVKFRYDMLILVVSAPLQRFKAKKSIFSRDDPLKAGRLGCDWICATKLCTLIVSKTKLCSSSNDYSIFFSKLLYGKQDFRSSILKFKSTNHQTEIKRQRLDQSSSTGAVP